MSREQVKQFIQNIKQIMAETVKLLWQYKWYILLYALFYGILLMNYFMPSPKNYFLWYKWYDYSQPVYLGVTRLLLIIFALLFFVGTSNMRNHPLLAKTIFLSSLYFVALLLEII